LRALGGTVWRRARRSVVVRTKRRLNKSSPQRTIIRTVIVVAVEVEDGLAFGTSRKKGAAGVTREEEEAEDAEEEEDQPILDLDLFEEERIDFTVCNPPFFNTMSESSQNPRTNFGGTTKENSYRGGESSFVRRMILESRQVALSLNSSKGEENQHRVRWFTTMVGAKATLKMAKKCLREMKETTKLRETAFVQGKTRRWGLAWSFL
jgi:hypothetical protein